MSMHPMAPQSAPPPRRGWWSRNWFWFVPAGCLSMLAVFAAFIISIFMVVAGAMKSSDAYKEGVARAKANPTVIEALGQPIEEGFFVTGNINVSGSLGQANLSVSLSGPKGKGTLYIVATKSAGRWNYTTLQLQVKGRAEPIDLLSASDKLET